MSAATVGSGPGVMASLVELLLPRSCLGCGVDGRNWCRECMTGELEPRLHRPDPCPVGLPVLAAAASYSGGVRAAILAAKERDRRELDRPLGLMLAAAVGELLTAGFERRRGCDPLWLVPIPASPSALRERGRDHVSDWTRWTVRGLRGAGVPARSVPLLRRRAGGRDSVGLDAGQRADNLGGAFVLRPKVGAPRNAAVIVVDDIVTTGATLEAAATRLTTSLGVDPVRLGAAVVAATQRTGSSTGPR